MTTPNNGGAAKGAAAGGGVDVLAAYVKKRGVVKVECIANRGRRYRVLFSDKAGGGAELVESAYRRRNDTGTVYQTIWTWTSGRRMSLLVACAVRAAQEVALSNIEGASHG